VAVHLAFVSGDRPEASLRARTLGPQPPSFQARTLSLHIPFPMRDSLVSQTLRQIMVERHYRTIKLAKGPKYSVLEPLPRKTSGQVGMGKRYESKDAYFMNNAVHLGEALKARIEDFLKTWRPILVQSMLDFRASSFQARALSFQIRAPRVASSHSNVDCVISGLSTGLGDEVLRRVARRPRRDPSP